MLNIRIAVRPHLGNSCCFMCRKTSCITDFNGCNAFFWMYEKEPALKTDSRYPLFTLEFRSPLLHECADAFLVIGGLAHEPLTFLLKIKCMLQSFFV